MSADPVGDTRDHWEVDDVALGDRPYLELDGVKIPALRIDRAPAYSTWRAWIPLENGTVAMIAAFPRPDETEYAVSTAPAEEWTYERRKLILAPVDSTWHERPRGDIDLLETLRDLAKTPSPSTPERRTL